MSELDETERKLLEAHLDEKWRNVHRCPICGQDDAWGVGDRIWYLSEASEKTDAEALRMPVAPVLCNKCGYTFFLNAVLCGLIK